MVQPSLVCYDKIEKYREHYEHVYCRSIIQTFDGIRVYFKPYRFDHVFYESTARDGRKDLFSRIRAERIDWIKATLQNPEADLFQGWDKKRRQYSPHRRVAVIYESFVVIVAMRLKRNNELKAEFITCYQAENSIGKIKSAPVWNLEDCREQLLRKKKDR